MTAVTSKRRQPEALNLAGRHAALVAKACRIIETGDSTPKLNELARTVGMSPFHFQRIFRRMTGLSPKAYATAHRAEKVRSRLAQGGNVTEAIYDAGFNSNGRFYAQSARLLGMAPRTFRRGGSGATIRFAVGECSLGSILVASSEEGICAIFLGNDPDELARNLQRRFRKAQIIGGDRDYENVVAMVVGLVENPQLGLQLPLDIRGTSFQQRVWLALAEIPAGKTMSYAQIAKRIGKPQAVRAVAQACGANPLAVAIPCHRVVRKNGDISGYRWGVERKRALLQREKSLPQ